MKSSHATEALRFNADGLESTASLASDPMTGTFYSTPIGVAGHASYGMQFIWASGTSPVGTLTLEFSWDGTTWSDSGVTGVAISGNSGSTFANVTSSGGEPLARLKYARTSGSGTATGFFFGKEQ